MTKSDPIAVESESVGALEREELRQEAIELRAYEISLAGEAGSDLDNWLRAERELQALDEPD